MADHRKLEKFRPDQIQRAIGPFIYSYGRYLVNRARRLDHYYKTKFAVSGQDAH